VGNDYDPPYATVGPRLNAALDTGSPIVLSLLTW